MAAERIVSAINQAEAQKDNVQRLDAEAHALSRRLLYGQVTEGEEIAGYRYLRNLTSHSDKIAREAVDYELDKRWGKVGFYEFHKKSPFAERDYFKQVESNEIIDWSQPNGLSGIDDGAKIAILELCRRRSKEGSKFITIKEFGKITSGLSGREDSNTLINGLRWLYLLTDEAKYVPLIESEKGKIKLNEEAYETIKPHLPVLEAISYPEEALSKQDKKVGPAINKEIDSLFGKARSFFAADIKELTSSEELFFPVGSGDIEQLRQSDRSAEGSKDRIAFIADDEKMYSIISSFFPRSSDIGDITLRVLQQQPNIKGRLIYSFFGGIVAEELGRLKLFKERYGNKSVEASGIFLQSLPGSLPGADRIEIAKHALTASWNVSSESKKIPLSIYYMGLRGGLPYISCRQIGIHNRGGIILLDKKEDVLDIHTSEGKYKVSYRKTGNEFLLHFAGEGWQKDITVPSEIDPLGMMRYWNQGFSEAMQKVPDQRDAIKQQVTDAKKMTLAENLFYSNFGYLPTSEAIHLSPDIKDKFMLYETIDKGILALEPELQWYVKQYMFMLSSLENLPKEYEEAFGDPREQFRQYINKRSILIPEDLLEASELLFMPRKYFS